MTTTTTSDYSLSLFKAATEVMETGSLVVVDGFAIFTNSQGTQFFTVGSSDELTMCEQEDVPTSILERIVGRDFTDMDTSGCMFTYAPILVDTVAVSAHKKPTVIIKKKRIQTPKPTKKAVPVAVEKPEMTPSNLSVVELLQQCSITIERLSENLHETQVEMKPLTELAGNPYRARKARALLVEHGLIEPAGKGFVLTLRGQEEAIGKHVRKATTQSQQLLFSDKVLPYIAEANKPVEKITVSFCVVSPDGVKYAVVNVRAFAKTHGLEASKLYLLNQGSIQSHRGWVLAK